MDLVDFIYSSNKAETIEELTKLFMNFINNYGFNSFLFSEVSHDSIMTKNKDIGLIVNHPMEWMDYYQENDYALHDPVYQSALKATRPFTWTEASRIVSNSKSDLIMNEAREHGLISGIGIPINVHSGQLYGIGISSPEKNVTSCKDSISIINAAANHLCLAYTDKFGVSPSYDNIRLTKREQEVIIWVAAGKTKTEIGKILLVSDSTIKRHCANIFIKFSVNNLASAVAMAFRHGFIN